MSWKTGIMLLLLHYAQAIRDTPALLMFGVAEEMPSSPTGGDIVSAFKSHALITAEPFVLCEKPNVKPKFSCTFVRYLFKFMPICVCY